MPIYEFACPKCRVIYSFLSKRMDPERVPVCPKCGHKKLTRQLSTFAAVGRAKEASVDAGEPGGPDLEDPRLMRAMADLERDMAHLDENNPRHMAHVMRKMKDALPPGSMPKELDVAIKRLEAGEDPEQIEADMGDVMSQLLGEEGGSGGGGGAGGYARDSGLYDM